MVVGVSCYKFSFSAWFEFEFLEKSVQIHPDVNPVDPSNHMKFVQLKEAYSVLSNISSRREYDFQLQHLRRVKETAASYAESMGSQTRYRFLTDSVFS